MHENVVDGVRDGEQLWTSQNSQPAPDDIYLPFKSVQAKLPMY
jgi:hypothetical protein